MFGYIWEYVLSYPVQFKVAKYRCADDMGDAALTETEYNVTNINAFVIIMDYHPSYSAGAYVKKRSPVGFFWKKQATYLDVLRGP